ncbi:MAG: calcium-binding protein [Hyphomicrobiales bacterium]
MRHHRQLLPLLSQHRPDLRRGSSPSFARQRWNAITSDDDSGVGRNSALTFTPGASGTYFLDVGEFETTTPRIQLPFASALATAFWDQLTDGHDETTIAFLQHRVFGGKGADKITLGTDPCEALGEQGNDLIIGGDGGDRISGGLGNDTLEGGAGTDILWRRRQRYPLWSESELDVLLEEG